MTHPEEAAASRPRSPYVIGVLGSSVLVAAVTALVFAATSLDQRLDPPACAGIGWGCTPDPATGALIVGVLTIWIPVAVGLILLVLEPLRLVLGRTRARQVQTRAAWVLVTALAGLAQLWVLHGIADLVGA